METSKPKSGYKHATILLSVLCLIHNYDRFIAGTRFAARYATVEESGWIYTLTTIDFKEKTTLSISEKEISKHFRIGRD